jgi:hypothetical protein
MKERSELDQLIHSRLEQLSPPVNPAIWENIQKEQRKRRGIFFWWSSKPGKLITGAVLIALTGLGIFLWKKEGAADTLNPTTNPTSQLNIASNNLPGEQQPASTVNSGSKDSHLQKENKLKENDVLNRDASRENPTSTGEYSAARNSKRATQGSNTPDQDVSVTNGNEVLREAVLNSKKARKGRTNSRVRSTVQDGVLGDAVLEDNNQHPVAQSNTLLMDYKVQSMGLVMAPGSTVEPWMRFKENAALSIPCPKKSKEGSGNSYFELYAGPDYSFRNFTDTANSVYLQRRKESTKFQMAFSIGARYTKVFSNGLSLRGGLNFTQVNEQFSYSDGNFIQVVYVTNAGGDTIGSYQTSSSRVKKTYNKFRMLDIPISIGYETGGEKWRFNFNGGLIMNVYSWQRGDVLNKSLQPVNINTGGESSAYQYKTNIGLGLTGAVSVYYKLNDRLHFLAEPYFRYNFSPVSKSELTLRQKYHMVGLRLGIRMDLWK